MELLGIIFNLSLCMVMVVAMSAPGPAQIGVDGGYADIVIKINKDACREDCPARVRRLKVIIFVLSPLLIIILMFFQELLTISSAELNKQLTGRAYFQSFTIVVPSSWKDHFCEFGEEEVLGLGARQPDIIVERGEGRPYVEHSRGCGEQGDVIYVPDKLFDHSVNTTQFAKEFVNRWIDFRFGVFGFEMIKDEMVTEENISDNSEDGDDIIKIPRQALLCGGKTFEEVIGEHPDSLGVKTDNEPMRAILPEIRVIREPEVKYVLAIETTASMLEGDHWKWVNKAAQKLIRYDLPVNTSIAIVSFNNDTKIENHLEVLTEDARERIADTIPGKYQIADNDDRGVVRLFEKIIGEVLSEDMGGAHVILITNGGEDSLTVKDEQTISKYVRKHGIKISTVMIPTVNHLAYYDDVSQFSGGHSFLIRKSPYPMDTYVNILEAFLTIIQKDETEGDNSALVVHKNEHFTGSNTTWGAIKIDSSYGQDTFFGIYVEDPEDHLIKSVIFEDEQGKVYGPYTKMSTSFDLINFKTPNIAGDSPFSGDKGQVWKYQIEWFAETGDPRKSVVMVTSRNKSGKEMVTLSSWVSRRQWSPDFHHLTLFTRIRQGNKPVVNASVSASIEIETENGTFVGMSPRVMFDDGAGDDDVIHGDGIYTLTITDYPAKGRYKFSITADDSDTHAYATTKVSVNNGIKQSAVLKTESFSRTSYGPVLHLSHLPSRDSVPPSKIGDLVIAVSDNNNTLFASWTATGGDLHAGAVSTYVVVYAHQVQDLLDPDAEPVVLTVIDKQALAGEKVDHPLIPPLYNQACFIGVYGVDEAGNRGAMSNIRQVFVSKMLSSSTVIPDLITGLETSSESDWMMIMVMSSCLGGLFLICISCISYFFISAKRERPVSPSPSSSTTKEDIHMSDQTDSSSCDSDRNSCSQVDRKDLDRHQVTELHQILADQHRIVPVYWSASQLLSKLEQQKQSTSSESIDTRSYSRYSNSLAREFEEPNNESHSGDGGDRTFDRELIHNNPLINRTRDSETDFVDSEHSLDDLENHNEVPRTSSRDQQPFRFERNGFYKSTRIRGSLEDSSYHDFCPPEVKRTEIPEKYFVTVSGFEDAEPNFSATNRDFSQSAKPRNITEV